MSRPTPALVLGRDGLRGTLEPQPAEAGRVVIRLADGRVAHVAADLLTLQEDGSYRLDLGLADLGLARVGAGAGAVGARVGAAVGPALGRAEDRAAVIPVIREELDVAKRLVETGAVRVRKVVREREEVVDVPLLREQVDIERIPIDRYIDGPVEVRHEGDIWIIPLVEEVLIIEKRLLLKEEIKVTRRQVEDRSPQKVILRAEEAVVERVDSQGLATEN